MKQNKGIVPKPQEKQSKPEEKESKKETTNKQAKPAAQNTAPPQSAAAKEGKPNWGVYYLIAVMIIGIILLILKAAGII